MQARDATGQISCSGLAGESAQALYQAAVNGRDALQEQDNVLLVDRRSIADRLRLRNAAPGADQEGLEARIKAKDAQIADVEGKLNDANAAVARTAAVPCVVTSSPNFPNFSNRDKEYALSALFMLVFLFPMSVAMSRRIWRRGSAAIASLPRELSERLSRLEQSVESVAIEVERIGEGQRFMTNVLVDSVSERALGAGTMEAIPVKPREPAEQLRRE